MRKNAHSKCINAAIAKKFEIDSPVKENSTHEVLKVIRNLG